MCDAAGDPLLVVMAEPAASLASELRRLIPDLRTAVGDDRRVLVGFDRGGWSPTLFADLDAAGFDTLTWRKGAATDIEEALVTECVHTAEKVFDTAIAAHRALPAPSRAARSNPANRASTPRPS